MSNKAIILAGLLLSIGATAASAQPYCWWDGFAPQCGQPGYWRGYHREHDWRREEWRRSHEEWQRRHHDEERR